MSLRSALELPQRYISQESTNPNPRLGTMLCGSDNAGILITPTSITSVGEDITIQPGGGYNLNIGGFAYDPVIQYVTTANLFVYSGLGGINRYTLTDANALPTSGCAITQVSAGAADAQTAWIVNSYASEGTVSFTTASQIADASLYSVCVTVCYGAGNAPPPVPVPAPVQPAPPVYVPPAPGDFGFIQSPLQTSPSKSFMGTTGAALGWAYSFYYSLLPNQPTSALVFVPTAWFSAQNIVGGNATYVLNAGQPPVGTYYVATRIQYFNGVSPIPIQTTWSSQTTITIEPLPPTPPGAFVPGALDWNAATGLLSCAVTSENDENIFVPPVEGDLLPAYRYTLQYTLNQPEQLPIGVNYRPATDVLVSGVSQAPGTVAFQTVLSAVNATRPFFRVRLDAYSDIGIVAYSTWSPTFVSTTPVPPPPPPPPAEYTPGALGWNPATGLLTCVLTSPDAENTFVPPVEGDPLPAYRYTLQYTLSQPEQLPIGTGYRPATDVLVSNSVFDVGSVGFQTVLSSVLALRPYFRVRLDAYSAVGIVAYTTWSPTFVTTVP